MIAILDYGIGNLKSIHNMFKKIGIDAVITSDIHEIQNADKYLLPGVGSFDYAIMRLKNASFFDVLEKEVLEGDELDELLGYPKKAHRSIDDEFEEGQLASEYKPQDQDEGKTSESDPAADNGDESQRIKKDRAQDDEDPDDEEE